MNAHCCICSRYHPLVDWLFSNLFFPSPDTPLEALTEKE